MTVSNSTSRADYTGNGVTVAFTIPFYFLDSTHIQVVRRTISSGVEQTLALTTDYTVTGAGVFTGGTLTMLTAPTAGQKITVLRNVPSSQLTHYVENDPFPAASHEMALDKLTMLVQQIYETLGRAVLSASTESPGPSALPLIAARANKFLGFDAAGNPVAFSGTGNDTALRTDLASTIGAALLGFLNGGVGAVQRTTQAKLQDGYLSPLDYGCKFDNATDDAVNLRKAIVAAQTLGLPLFIHGTCLINSAVVIDGPLTLIGSGPDSAIIRLGSATQDGLQIVTNSKVTMRDLQISGSAVATAGSSVLLTAPGGGVNQFSSFDNVYFNGGWIQLNNGATAEWSCMRCTFAGFRAVGIQIQDTFNTDAGDQQVIGCVFTTAAGVGTGIVQVSAGGLRLIGCKFIQIANGLTLSPAAGVNISDLFLCGNSFESFTGAAVTFTRGSGNLIGTIHIACNEFVGGAQAFNMSDVGPWINNMTIVCNTFGITGSSTCVTLAGVLNCTFADNILNGNATGTGLNIGTVGANVQVHHNTFSGFATNIGGAVTGVNGAVTNRNVVIERNLGYNPVGASALSPTASPWTFTNGASPADLYMAGSTNIVGVTLNGVGIMPAATGAGVNFFVRLGPNEVIVVTYGGTLTAKQMVH